jgi:IS5 family transposase
MRQSKKGKELHFGIKMYIGVYDTLGLIHTVGTTAANVCDPVLSGNVLQSEERRVLLIAATPVFKNGPSSNT